MVKNCLRNLILQDRSCTNNTAYYKQQNYCVFCKKVKEIISLNREKNILDITNNSEKLESSQKSSHFEQILL